MTCLWHPDPTWGMPLSHWAWSSLPSQFRSDDTLPTSQCWRSRRSESPVGTMSADQDHQIGPPSSVIVGGKQGPAKPIGVLRTLPSPLVVVWAQSTLESSSAGVPVTLASLTLVAVAIALSMWLRLRIEREVVVAAVRAAIQLLAVGLLFVVIFESARAMVWAWFWVLAMSIVATVVVVRRASQRVPGLLLATTLTVVGAALVSIAVTFGFGVVDYNPVSLVVIAGITIGNAVPSAVLGVNHGVELARDRIGELEAQLALGFDRAQIVGFMAPRVARTAFIPQIERTKVVGLIALPGAMTGLLLAGVEPMDAVLVQLLVMYLVLGTAALCVVATVAAITRAATTPELGVSDWVTTRAAASD